jgi:predicted HAD superfamily phosphohydrolase YqeG
VAVKPLATGSSAFSTFFQTLPRLFAVIRRMQPTWHLPSLAAVSDDFLRQHGIRGLIWDVDGTLTGDRKQALETKAEADFRRLIGTPGLAHVVLSNSSEERYRELGTMFPELPILRAYREKDAVLFRRLQGTSDSWTAGQLGEALERGAVMIRKPSKDLVDYALRELKLAAAEVAMVGDQYMTDVAGANYGGVRSIKLPTLAPETFRVSVKVSQNLEKAIYAVFHGGKGS